MKTLKCAIYYYIPNFSLHLGFCIIMGNPLFI